MTTPSQPSRLDRSPPLAARIREWLDRLATHPSFDPTDDVSRADLVRELQLQQEELRAAYEQLRHSAEELELAGRDAERASAHYRDLFELAPDPFFVTDRAGTIRELNAAAVDLVGVARKPGTPLEEALHPADVEALRNLIVGATVDPTRVRLRFQARTGRSARAGVRAALAKDGSEILWMVRLERGASGIEGPVTPISQRPSSSDQSRIDELAAGLAAAERKAVAERMAREDAEGRDRIKQWTMAIVAHGMRLPIEHIQKWGTATPGRESPERSAVGCEVIRRHTALQEELVADLLDVSRVSDLTLRAAFQAIDPRDAVDFVVTTFRPMASETSVEIESQVDDVGRLHGDPIRLVQALSNLAWNAIHLSKGRTRVTIATRRAAEDLTLSIAWTGEAVRTEQLDWQLARLGDGQVARDRVGMSCLVARQLIQLHGGRLRASSGDDRHALVASFPAVASPATPSTVPIPA